MEKTFAFKSLEEITPETITQMKSLIGKDDEVEIAVRFNRSLSEEELANMKRRARELKLKVKWSLQK